MTPDELGAYRSGDLAEVNSIQGDDRNHLPSVQVRRSCHVFPRYSTGPQSKGQQVSRKKSATEVLKARRRAADLRAIRKAGGQAAEIGELRFVRTWIDADLLAAEPSLVEMAWVENRYLSPLKRTELFAEAYVAKVHRALWRRRGPIAAKSQPLEREFALNSPAVMNALWRARAEADLLGVPYELYLDVVIDGHLTNDKWQRPPRPNQLYGKLAGPRLRGRLTGQELSMWLELVADPRFTVDYYRGDPVQMLMHRLIRQDVLAANNPASTLAAYLVDYRMITPECAESLLGTELVVTAIAERGLPEHPKPQSQAPFRPMCLGYYQVNAEQCGACPVRHECRVVDVAVRAELVRVTGTDNPRLEHKRRVNRERQRRHRERKKKRQPS